MGQVKLWWGIRIKLSTRPSRTKSLKLVTGTVIFVDSTTLLSGKSVGAVAGTSLVTSVGKRIFLIGQYVTLVTISWVNTSRMRGMRQMLVMEMLGKVIEAALEVEGEAEVEVEVVVDSWMRNKLRFYIMKLAMYTTRPTIS